jgi:hypothetical protein
MELAIHQVRLSAKEADKLLLSQSLFWQIIDPVDSDSCNITTEFVDSDTLRGLLDAAGIEWRIM